MTNDSLIREHHNSREDWLSARDRRGIGGSEAAAVVNMSPYMTSGELWDRKANKKNPANLSANEFVSKGVRVEPALRSLYKANHPEYIIEYYPYDLLYQKCRPWLFATLDGEIVKEDGSRGILEIKTATPNGHAGWKKWDRKVPNNYYLQCAHQLLATGYGFVVLYAGLYAKDGTMSIREYEIERNDIAEDMEWLLKEETKFWYSIETKTIPGLTLVI